LAIGNGYFKRRLQILEGKMNVGEKFMLDLIKSQKHDGEISKDDFDRAEDDFFKEMGLPNLSKRATEYKAKEIEK
jgi:hypothetical protein